jgi:hypothetical protein
MLALVLVTASLLAHAPLGTLHTRCEPTDSLGAAGVGNWPSACWRPYSDRSPFNQTIAGAPPASPGSGAIVRHLLAGAAVSSLVAGDPGRGGSPTYYSRPGDPTYRLHCAKPWGRCEVEGMRVAVPAAAQPTGGVARPGDNHDAHMTIVDPATGWEYDLWHVTRKPPHGGRLVFGWGGRTRIDGRGLGSGGVAAGFGNLAGLIRGPELARGRIDHALTMAVPCVRGRAVYPATGQALSCAAAGLAARDAPRLGSRFQLRVSSSELDRMPGWKRAIALALKRYGAYVNDTTGNPDWWGFSFEGPATYTSFGRPDPLARLGKRLGLTPTSYANDGHRGDQPGYWFNLNSAIPWKGLRVLRPCVTRGGC